MNKIIIEELLENVNEHMEYKKSSYCRGQIHAYKKILELMDTEILDLVIESKRD